MAQVTALVQTATPGKIRTFSAKAAAVVATADVVAITLKMAQQVATSFKCAQQVAVTLKR